jgi:hypothetical protein
VPLARTIVSPANELLIAVCNAAIEDTLMILACKCEKNKTVKNIITKIRRCMFKIFLFIYFSLIDDFIIADHFSFGARVVLFSFCFGIAVA